MSSPIDSEKHKFVYLMGQNYQKLKFEKYVLESNKIFQTLIREIEDNLEEKCSLVIFLPSVKMEQLQELVKYVAKDSSEKLRVVNKDLEEILYKLGKIAGSVDPDEVVESVDLPTDEWLGIVDNFITNEYPELKEDISEKTVRNKRNSEALMQVKVRAINWLAPQIQNNKFVEKFCIFSLIDAILPGFESYSEQLTPTLVKHFINWGQFEFTGIGSKVMSAKEDAAIYAISRLLDINLKTFTPPSKTKLLIDVMPKIRLDKVSSRYFEEVFEMSVQLPNGQVVKRRGHSLHNAKEKTFLLASKLIATEKRLTVERTNKTRLVEFYQKEMRMTPELPAETELLGSLDPTLIIKEALRDFNQNEIKAPVPRLMPDDERDNLKRHGLDRVKPFLKKHLFRELTPAKILSMFLPGATLSGKKKVKVTYKTLKWSQRAKTTQEAEEIVVNTVLQELFDIKLVPVFFQNQKELKEKLPTQVLTAKNGKQWTSSIAVRNTIISASGNNPDKAQKFAVKKAFSAILQKHEEEALFSNRVEFSKFIVDKNSSSLTDRIKFITKYFTVERKHRNIHFETTNWLLRSFERRLLDEVHHNVHIQQLQNGLFKATVCLNSDLLSVTRASCHQAKLFVILRAFKEVAKQEDKFIVVSKPIVTNEMKDFEVKKPCKEVGEKNEVAPVSKRDVIASYRKKALELIYSDRFKIQQKRSPCYNITPLCILHNVIVPEKVKILRETQLGPTKYETTIEVAQKAVTGYGPSKKDAKQEAGRLAFLHILKVDWDRAVKGLKQH